MMRLSASETVCLTALADLMEEYNVVTSEHLIRCLPDDLSHVFTALRGLSQRTLIQSTAQGILTLTETGHRFAREAQRQHRLLERFLFDVVGVPWTLVHREALRLTPMISQPFYERVIELTRRATVCPHGNPISGRSDRPTDECLLTAAPLGQRCRLSRIAECACYEPHLLQRLWHNELLPDRALVRVPDPLYQWVIRVNQRSLVIGQRVASMLYVVVDRE